MQDARAEGLEALATILEHAGDAMPAKKTEPWLTIISNRQPRDLICLLDLSEREREDFDYLSEEEYGSPRLFRYRGHVYDAGEFMAVGRGMKELKGWDGYHSDSYFSGILIRYTDEYCDQVIVGRYYS